MFNWLKSWVKNSDNSNTNEETITPRTTTPRATSVPTAVIVTSVLGIIAIIAYGLTFDAQNHVSIDLPIVSRISVAALAAASSGWVIGFLFGIPRAKPPGTQDQSKSEKEGTNDNYQSQEESFFQYNNNLSDVSDWLTKILVGISLTQVDAIKANFGQIIDLIANGGSTENFPELKGFVFTVVIYFTGVGAFLGFLWAVYRFPLNYERIQDQLDRDKQLK